MKEAIKIIFDSGLKDDYVIIGVSSGPDSMCLLDILIKNKCKPVVAHINYHKRKESNLEAEYLKKYCISNNIPFEIKDYKKENNKNFQQEARNFRYHFFSELATKYNTKYIMTAHHGDDLIETILMRLSRGSNFSGYIGFKEISIENDLVLIRPLIKYNKEEILKYNKINKVKFFNDKSNDKDDYTRNRYRHKILPILKSENKKVNNQYYQFSKMLIDYENYFNKEAEERLHELFNDYLCLNKYANLNHILKQRVIELILKKIYKNDINLVNKKNVIDIMNLITNSQPNLSILLPKQLLVRKSYDKLFLEFEKTNKLKYEYILNDVVKINDHEIIRLSKSKRNNSNNYTTLNSREIKLPLVVRTRKVGDKIKLKNLGTKKVKEILIDKKIDIIQRNNIPVVVDSNDVIVWLPGIKKSTFDKKDDYDIILEYINEGK